MSNETQFEVRAARDASIDATVFAIASQSIFECVENRTALHE